jgi:hypothetical protein
MKMQRPLDRTDLETASLADLHDIARELGLSGYRRLRKEDLIDRLLEHQPAADERAADEPETQSAEARSRAGRRARTGRRESETTNPPCERRVEGEVERLQNGSALLHVQPPGASRGDDDVYISAAMVKIMGLDSGDYVIGASVPPRRSERRPTIIRIDVINGESPVTRAGRPQLLEVPVAATLTVSNLEELCSGLNKMYRAFSIAVLVAGLDRNDLEVVAYTVDNLLPARWLEVASISIASPGEINLRGSGEVVRAIDRIFKTAYTRKEIRKRLQLENAELELELENRQRNQELGAEISAIEIAMMKYRAVKEVLTDTGGYDILSTDAGRQLLADILSGADAVHKLSVAGLLELPRAIPPTDSS